MSGSTLLTAPALEPVTIEEARSQCRITDSSEDGLLGGYLLAARSLTESRTGRALATQTWIDTFDRDWPPHCGRDHHHHHRGWYSGAMLHSQREIMLWRAPVQSVSSVKYFDTNGAQQTLDPSQYLVGTRQLVGVVEQAYGVSWPAVRCQVDTISVQYVAGYAAAQIPETIRQAILLLVAHFYRNREAVVISASRAVPIEIPIGIDALLAPYVVPWAF